MTYTKEQLEAMLAGATKGPWDQTGGHKEKTQFGVFGMFGRSVCSTGGYSDGKEATFGENKANATLIAAAPTLATQLIAAMEREAELMDALEFYADGHANPNDGPWGYASQDFGKVARAALAKGGES